MIDSIRQSLKRVPIIGPAIASTLKIVRGASFRGSANYWESRYNTGGNSGAGSYGHLAEFKASVINSFIIEHDIQTIIEFGCGDGHQLELATYRHYVGFDVSPKAVELCRTRFASRPELRFALTSEYSNETADLSMSLDVIYHLVEDNVFDGYMRRLFDSSNKFVILYSCNAVIPQIDTAHVKTRMFSNWIEQNRSEWRLIKHIPNKYPYNPAEPENTSFADFYIYQQQEAQS